ncbi:MAG: DUF58 domain-containing protein [Lachnospiraceae bacterium]|nr:DUF58 domain-containing protein [Lachnospiraceae bacterium]
MIWNWICYLLVMGAIGFSTVMFAERFFVIIFVLGLALPVAGLVCMLLMRRKILASLHADETHVQSGAVFAFHISVTNYSILPCACVYTEIAIQDILGDVTEDIVGMTAVAGKSVSRMPLTVSSLHCGRVGLTIRKVVASVPFGFFRVKVRVESPTAEFLIYPPVVDAGLTLVRPNPYAYIAEEEYSKTRPGDDPSELFGVREYRPGDRPNRIHWGLTAARDETMVKELGLPIDTSVLLLTDICTLPAGEAAKQYDALMTTVASVARRLLRDHQIFYVGWMTGPDKAWHMRVAEEEEWDAVLIQLFGIRPYEGTSVAQAYGGCFADERYRNILLVTNRFTKEVADGIAAMRADANVTVFGIGENTTRPENLSPGDRFVPVRPRHLSEDLGIAADSTFETEYVG